MDTKLSIREDVVGGVPLWVYRSVQKTVSVRIHSERTRSPPTPHYNTTPPGAAVTSSRRTQPKSVTDGHLWAPSGSRDHELCDQVVLRTTPPLPRPTRSQYCILSHSERGRREEKEERRVTSEICLSSETPSCGIKLHTEEDEVLESLLERPSRQSPMTPYGSKRVDHSDGGITSILMSHPRNGPWARSNRKLFVKI